MTIRMAMPRQAFVFVNVVNVYGSAIISKTMFWNYYGCHAGAVPVVVGCCAETEGIAGLG